jgi:hypothetical protein
VVVNWSAHAHLVSISDALESVSELGEDFLLVCSLLATSDVDLIRHWILCCKAKVLVCVIFLEPIVLLLVLDADVRLLNDRNEDVHDNTT